MEPPTPIEEAFAKALAQIGIAIKDSRNPHFGNAYASLGSIQELVREPLKNENLVLNQQVDYDPVGQCVVVTTNVWGMDGTRLNLGNTRLPVPKLTPQDAGSAISYARRYALIGLFGVQVEEDDGEAAQQAHRGQSAQPVKRIEPPSEAKSKLPEGKGWDNDEPQVRGANDDGVRKPSEEPMMIKGREWFPSSMNPKQLATVAYTGSYLKKHVDLCEKELLKRVAAGDKEADEIVTANSQP